MSVPLPNTVFTRAVGGLLLLAALLPALTGCDVADPIEGAATMSSEAGGTEAVGTIRVLLQSSKSISIPPGFFSPSVNFLAEDDGLVEKVEVTITRVELHSKDGKSITLSDESQTFDLLALQGGEKARLVKLEDLPHKSYHRMDLTISKAAVVLALAAETVRLEAEGVKKTATVPLPNFEIESKQLAKLALNVDLDKSFTVKAKPHLHLQFHPAVEALGFNYEGWGGE